VYTRTFKEGGNKKRSVTRPMVSAIKEDVGNLNKNKRLIKYENYH
jgi:hypothetical protein